jgi:hypothetical protein
MPCLRALVEQAAALQPGDDPPDLVDALERAHLAHTQRLRLHVIVAQDEFGHIVGHRGEQFVAFAARHAFALGDIAQEDLDVDLAIGAVDTRGIVDEVGVDAAASQAEFDACPLCQAEVAAFPDYLAAKLVGVDAHIVVAAVAHVSVSFGAGLDVRADAAVPQQVDTHSHYRSNQFVRLHG